MDKKDAITLSASWIDGKYEFEDCKVEVNTSLSYVAIDDLEGNSLWYFQGEEADKVIEEVFTIWTNTDKTQSEALGDWINNNL